MGNLTALQVKNLKTPGRYSDGDGLMLQVNKGGSGSWLLRVMFDGKRRDIGLGSLSLVSLAEARELAVDLRRQVRTGVDVVAERRQAKIVVPTFREAALTLHKELLKGWKNGKHTDQWLSTLETYAYPKLGMRPVDEIEGPLIREVLSEIWIEKPETARRLKQRICSVLDWSYVNGFRAAEAPTRSIAKGLPRQRLKVGHFAAMPYDQVPGFLSKLRKKRPSLGRLALEATILTAVRSGEFAARVGTSSTRSWKSGPSLLSV